MSVQSLCLISTNRQEEAWETGLVGVPTYPSVCPRFALLSLPLCPPFPTHVTNQKILHITPPQLSLRIWILPLPLLWWLRVHSLPTQDG